MVDIKCNNFTVFQLQTHTVRLNVNFKNNKLDNLFSHCKPIFVNYSQRIILKQIFVNIIVNLVDSSYDKLNNAQNISP